MPVAIAVRRAKRIVCHAMIALLLDLAIDRTSADCGWTIEAPCKEIIAVS
jgi:hypothetical protein